MGKKIANEHGSALLITIAVMLMLTIAAMIAVNTANTDIDLSFNQLHHDQAFYIAEAGIKRSHEMLNDNQDWRAGFTDEAFESGSYTTVLTLSRKRRDRRASRYSRRRWTM